MSGAERAADVYADLAAHAEAAEQLVAHALPAIQRCVRLAGDLPLGDVVDEATAGAHAASLTAALRVQLHDLVDRWTAAREASSVGGGA